MEFMADTKALQKYFDILSIACPDAIVHVRKDSLFTRAVDAANIMMSDMTIPCVATEEWDFGINTLKVSAILKNTNDASVRVSTDGCRIVITTGRAVYRITTLDMRTIRKEPAPPTLVWNATLTLDVSDLIEGIKAVMVSKSKKDRQLYVWFKWDKTKFHIATSDQLDPVVATYNENEITVNRQSDDTCIVAISVDYLENIKDFITSFEECTIGITSDYPLGFLVTTDEGYKLAFMIAPRIPPKEEGGCPI